MPKRLTKSSAGDTNKLILITIFYCEDLLNGNPFDVADKETFPAITRQGKGGCWMTSRERKYAKDKSPTGEGGERCE